MMTTMVTIKEVWENKNNNTGTDETGTKNARPPPLEAAHSRRRGNRSTAKFLEKTNNFGVDFRNNKECKQQHA